MSNKSLLKLKEMNITVFIFRWRRPALHELSFFKIIHAMVRQVQMNIDTVIFIIDRLDWLFVGQIILLSLPAYSIS